MPPLDLRLSLRLGEEVPSQVVWGPCHWMQGALLSPPTDASGLCQGYAQGRCVLSLVLRCRRRETAARMRLGSASCRATAARRASCWSTHGRARTLLAAANR